MLVALHANDQVPIGYINRWPWGNPEPWRAICPNGQPWILCAHWGLKFQQVAPGQPSWNIRGQVDKDSEKEACNFYGYPFLCSDFRSNLRFTRTPTFRSDGIHVYYAIDHWHLGANENPTIKAFVSDGRTEVPVGDEAFTAKPSGEHEFFIPSASIASAPGKPIGIKVILDPTGNTDERNEFDNQLWIELPNLALGTITRRTPGNDGSLTVNYSIQTGLQLDVPISFGIYWRLSDGRTQRIAIVTPDKTKTSFVVDRKTIGTPPTGAKSIFVQADPDNLLLEINETDNLSENSLPDYAMRSMRWLPNGELEVTYDVSGGETLYESNPVISVFWKKGAKKIRHTKRESNNKPTWNAPINKIKGTYTTNFSSSSLGLPPKGADRIAIILDSSKISIEVNENNNTRFPNGQPAELMLGVISSEVTDAPPAGTAIERMILWTQKSRTKKTIETAASTYGVHPHAIVGVIAYEAIANPAARTVGITSATGLAKLPICSPDSITEQIELLRISGIPAPQNCDQRLKHLKTTANAVKYIAAIMNVHAVEAENAGYQIRDKPEILAELFCGKIIEGKKQTVKSLIEADYWKARKATCCAADPQQVKPGNSDVVGWMNQNMKSILSMAAGIRYTRGAVKPPTIIPFARGSKPFSAATMEGQCSGGEDCVPCKQEDVEKLNLALRLEGTGANSVGNLFSFWVNDDNDSTLDSEGWETARNSVADSADNRISHRRDLEDFSMLTLTWSGDLLKFLKCGYKLELNGGDNIQLFKAATINPLGHLTPWGAHLQMTSGFRPVLGGKFQLGYWSIPLSELGDYLTEEDFARGKACFLFEGRQTGNCQLVASLTRNFGANIKSEPVLLELLDIGGMYGEYQDSNSPLGQNVDGDFPEPPHVIVSGVPEPKRTMKAPIGTKDANNTVVLVHGWNMSVADKTTFAESMLKRLYWAGFGGRFVVYNWPTLLQPGYFGTAFNGSSFNQSEFIAFKHGPTLAALLNQLPGRVHVAAHSMGNIVASEALLRGGRADTYIMMQAAISAMAYDVRMIRPHDITLGISELGSPTFDELSTSHLDRGYLGYFSNVGQAAGRIVNFFNAADNAMWWWWVNQDVAKPSRYPRSSFLYDFEQEDPVGSKQSVWQKIIISPSSPPIYRRSRPVNDIHEVMAFMSRSVSLAVGAAGNTRGAISSSFDLSSNVGFGDSRPDHSGQFYRDIQDLWPFYRQLLSECGIAPNSEPNISDEQLSTLTTTDLVTSELELTFTKDKTDKHTSQSKSAVVSQGAILPPELEVTMSLDYLTVKWNSAPETWLQRRENGGAWLDVPGTKGVGEYAEPIYDASVIFRTVSVLPSSPEPVGSLEAADFPGNLPLEDAPEPITPVAEQLRVHPDVQFEWTSMPGAFSYTLKLYADNTNNLVATYSIPDTDEAVIEFKPQKRLAFNRRYLWQVCSENSAGPSPMSEPEVFITKDDDIPGPPIQFYPQNGETEVPVNVRVDWLGVPNADGYDYEIIANNKIVKEGLISATEIRVGLAYGEEYRWRVRSRVLEQNNPWSPYWGFRTVEPPGPPERLRPLKNATNVSVNVRLDWKSVSSARGYECIVMSGNDVIHPAGYLAGSDLVLKLKPDTSYKWRIRARILPQDNEWSDWWTFRTVETDDNENISAPTDLKGISLDSTSAKMTWTFRGENPDRFEIWQRKAGQNGFSLGERVPGNLRAAIRDRLTSGAAYDFVVYAVYAETRGIRSGIATVELPPSVCVPGNIKAEIASATSSRVSWTSSCGDPEKFEIWQRISGQGNYTFGENVPGNLRAATRDGLKSGTAYDFIVIAVRGDERSSQSNSGSVELPPSVCVPGNIKAEKASATSSRVSWTSNCGDPEKFEIWQRISGQGNYTFGENVPGNLRAATRDGLKSGTAYDFIVIAVRGDERSSQSNSGSVELPPLVCVPVNIKSESVSTTSAKISWTSDCGDADRFEIWQRISGQGNFVLGENVPGNLRAAVRDGLNAGAAYDFVVICVKGGERSSQSVSATVNLPEPPPPVCVPTSVAGTATSRTSARITWRSNCGDPDRFEIWQRLAGQSNYKFGENVSGSLRAAVRDGLQSGAVYEFVVFAVKGAAKSDQSTNVRVDLP